MDSSQDINSSLLKLASSVKLFTGMHKNHLTRLLGVAQKLFVKEGDLFFDQGDPGESFFVIVSGEVLVEIQSDDQWVTLTSLHPGDSFGEMCVIDEKIRSARIRANQDCLALQFQLSRLRTDNDLCAPLYLNIARVLSNRLKITSTSLADRS